MVLAGVEALSMSGEAALPIYWALLLLDKLSPHQGQYWIRL